ncbi:Hypothetical predicted protein [Cloeon dipterum]|uniref:Uncharacterized protein n=1 Tax=Cloeon dipterum TaxID=197152 RepID=A0A8S1DMX7_9INSE|nr:Hypothetical predicted protein [Cloeon dipterum]
MELVTVSTSQTKRACLPKALKWEGKSRFFAGPLLLILADVTRMQALTKPPTQSRPLRRAAEQPADHLNNLFTLVCRHAVRFFLLPRPWNCGRAARFNLCYMDFCWAPEEKG